MRHIVIFVDRVVKSRRMSITSTAHLVTTVQSYYSVEYSYLYVSKDGSEVQVQCSVTYNLHITKNIARTSSGAHVTHTYTFILL